MRCIASSTLTFLASSFRLYFSKEYISLILQQLWKCSERSEFYNLPLFTVTEAAQPFAAGYVVVSFFFNPSLLLLILCFTNALLEGLSLLDLSKQGGYNSFVTIEEFGSIDKRYTFF